MASSLATSLEKPFPDADVIRTHVLRNGILDQSLRGQAWAVMLGVHDRPCPPLDEHMKRVMKDSADSMTIANDAERTRREEPEFDQWRPSLQELLHVYCNMRGVKYTQGLNEVLAPVFFTKQPLEKVYVLFYALLQHMLPFVFRGDDLRQATRPTVKRLEAVLLYHLPDVVHRLDQSSVDVDMWAFPWVVSLFAEGVSIAPLLELWDRIIAIGDLTMPIFIITQLVAANREAVLSCEQEDIPVKLRGLLRENLQTPEDARSLFDAALVLRARTPQSFRELSRQAALSNSEDVQGQYTSLLGPVVCTSASEATSSAHTELRFIVLDVRPSENYHSARLPTAMALDASLMLNDPEKFEAALAIIVGLKGEHFCVLGEGDSNDDAVESVLAQLYKHSMPFVSTLQGGWKQVANLYQSGNIELANDTPVKKGRLAGWMQKVEGAKDHIRKARGEASVAGQAAAEAAKERATVALGSMGSMLSARSKKMSQKLGGLAGKVNQLTTNISRSGNQRLGQESSEASSSQSDEPRGLPPMPNSEGATVNIGKWLSMGQSAAWSCQAVSQNGSIEEGIILVCEDSVLFLSPDQARLNTGILKAAFPLLQLNKITFSKTDQKLTNFIFKVQTGQLVHKVVMMEPDALKACVALVKSNLTKFKRKQAAKESGNIESNTHPSPSKHSTDSGTDQSNLQEGSQSSKPTREENSEQAAVLPDGPVLNNDISESTTSTHKEEVSTTAQLQEDSKHIPDHDEDQCEKEDSSPSRLVDQDDTSSIANGGVCETAIEQLDPTPPADGEGCPSSPLSEPYVDGRQNQVQGNQEATTNGVENGEQADEDSFLKELEGELQSNPVGGSAATQAASATSSSINIDDDLPDWLK